jgi:hypothetical protein
MSFGEELSKVDTDKAVELFDELFGPEKAHPIDFWLEERSLAHAKFPVFDALTAKTKELESYFFDLGMSEDTARGIRIGIQAVKHVFSAYSASEIPDIPPPQEDP